MVMGQLTTVGLGITQVHDGPAHAQPACLCMSKPSDILLLCPARVLSGGGVAVRTPQ